MTALSAGSDSLRSFQFFDESVPVDRFRDVVGTAAFQTLLAITFKRMGRKSDDGFAIAALAKDSRCLKAVHHRHLYVHQYDIERLIFVFSVHNGVNSLSAVFD